MAVDDVRMILRALSEVRDRDFYPLWVRLTYAWPSPLPQINFRIYSVADSDDVQVSVWVSGCRPDGTDVSWGLRIRTEEDRLVVGATISAAEDELFDRSLICTDTPTTAEAIHTLAAEICGRELP
ncbi:hypothetical protein [Paractinoplanes lichenicola]|uniref:Uncharacterized protein n=1 Tax=Paractinoplanes lichenicola TaxID=2802976 RepID=A0ABS1VY43_9ACTN|nr:hypothetical protein [Actinoplanes lichenicola]MBL7259379.1 hypothetical protein [Actinoplanes lichenicola]